MSRTLAIVLRRAASAGLALLALAGAAQAQYTNYMRPGSSFSNIYAMQADMTLSNMIRQGQMRSQKLLMDQLIAQQAGKAAPSPTAQAAPPALLAASLAASLAAPPAPLSATDFKPSATRKAAEQVAAAVTDPAGRAQMLQVCREILSTVEATPGFRKHNLASALTLLLAASQQVLSGQEYSDAQTQDYMQRLNDEVVAAGYFARLNAEQRTRAYDTMVITGGLIAGIAHNGAETGNKEQIEQARSMARDALATFGVKL